jgi:type IV pilus assembly protein PilB
MRVCGLEHGGRPATRHKGREPTRDHPLSPPGSDRISQQREVRPHFAAILVRAAETAYDCHVARLKIGELLLEAKVLTREQLDHALDVQRTDGRKLGIILTALGVVTETQLTQTLGRQLSVPWVSLYHIDFSRQLLNFVPREIAEKFCLVPIYVRRVRKQGETLYVAMDDPTNEAGLGEVAKASSLPVKPMIACPSDIRAAIRVYYGGGTGTETATVRDAPVGAAAAASWAPSSAGAPIPTAMPETPTAIETPAARAPTEPPAPPADDSAEKDSPDAWPEVEAHTLELPKRHGPPMVALTLLDGTTLRLPARPRRSDAPEEPSAAGELTARDFISALRAVAHGQDASEILGEKVPLEAMCAALLSVLLRKGLIADWEFVEELRKM